MRGREAVRFSSGDLRRALADASPYVGIVAAEALGRYGEERDLDAALDLLVERADLRRNHLYVCVHALNALDALGARAGRARARIESLPRSDPAVIGKMQTYVPRLIEAILQQ